MSTDTPDIQSTPAPANPIPIESAVAGSVPDLSRGAISDSPPEQAASQDIGQAPLPRSSRQFFLFNLLPAWMVSMLVHMVGLLALALATVGSARNDTTVLSLTPVTEPPVIEQLDVPEQLAPVDIQQISSSPVADLQASTVPQSAPEIGVATDLDMAPANIDLQEFSEQTAPRSDLLKEIGALSGSGLQGRGSRMRGELLTRYGGSEGSEAAVVNALKWFAEHQLQDGSWSLDHRGGNCAGRCSEPGRIRDCQTGATALALLPFLGAGQTHLEGQYRQNVAEGLAFLVRSMQNNGSLMQGGGNMYAHGLASIALCEAYGMTNDRKLLAPAQAALNFIVMAQDPIGGGWRYAPQQPGDTSVIGWQLMALKSGHMAYLKIPPRTIAGASNFLDSVQTDGGAQYGYRDPMPKPSTTAIALLCRMYLGWKKDNAALQKGVSYLSSVGPSRGDMYYNYYASQVLRHWGGEPWEKWNPTMRDQLINSQCKEGHALGSWDIPLREHSNEQGGRLYVTAMATMILEVYYRYMPIYGKDAAEDDFPL
jgi:hypothetical protein